MSFLNLGLGEFLALFTAISGVVVALYLLDRSRRKQTVATLRFWSSAGQPAAVQRKRRVQQPWSLLLQLISLGLLLLAIAQVRWGSSGSAEHDHVLLLDTSSVMAARSTDGTLLNQSQAALKEYLRRLPPTDRAMLVRADALATPATRFETDRSILNRAIDATQPGLTALAFGQAVRFATGAQRSSGHSGEIVYAGLARGADGTAAPVLPPNFRILPVRQALQNCGIRKIGLRPDPTEPGLWDVYVLLHNDGTRAVTLPLVLRFGGSIAGTRRLTLQPGVDQDATFPVRTKAAGLLEARLLTTDAFPADDRASLELPTQQGQPVLVYSNSPEALKPIFAANPRIEARYLSPAAYQPPPANTIVVLDRFAPPQPPAGPSIWIAPPTERSPFPVRRMASSLPLTRWTSDHGLGAGIRTQNVTLDQATIYSLNAKDISVAEVQGGSVVVARTAPAKLAVIGFDPVRSALRYELATPLLFANLLRWMQPQAFREREINAGTVGSTQVMFDTDTALEGLQVSTETGAPVPYTLQGRQLRFFTTSPSVVRIVAGDRELVYSLTLPEVGSDALKFPAGVRTGLPPVMTFAGPPRELWPWLASLAALGFLTEWLLFGRQNASAILRRQPFLAVMRERFPRKPTRRAS